MSSFGSKTAGTILAEIQMTRTLFGGSVFLIEGEHDMRFWKSRIDNSICRLIPCDGKGNLLGALHLLHLNGVPGFLGIADADHDSLLGITHVQPNLIITETHDLESLLIKSPSLDRVLSEYGEHAKIVDVETRLGKSIRETLIDLALVFGRVRWLLGSRGGRAFTERVKPTRFVTGTSTDWVVDHGALFAEVAAMLSITSADVVTGITACPTCDPWVLCHGKDLLSLLCIGLGGPVGPRRVAEDIVAGILRQALETQVFETTALCNQIREWETANSPYRVL